MLEHISGLPDLILFWMNDVSVIRVSRCGITRGTLSSKHVLTLIWMIMTDGSFKIVLNWAVSHVRPSVQLAGAPAAGHWQCWSCGKSIEMQIMWRCSHCASCHVEYQTLRPAQRAVLSLLALGCA